MINMPPELIQNLKENYNVSIAFGCNYQAYWSVAMSPTTEKNTKTQTHTHTNTHTLYRTLCVILVYFSLPFLLICAHSSIRRLSTTTQSKIVETKRPTVVKELGLVGRFLLCFHLVSFGVYE